MASTHLAFDLGAGSGRAMLGTLADGRLLGALPAGASIRDVVRASVALATYLPASGRGLIDGGHD
jgi:hypothetical protein